ncbi:GDSL family lipase [Paenibacillus athensensis]|uniref:GDSL-type esterase/lipase family protein n=1 Tax=Paenibacillus athensensis TaxID=1967502 RepID=UPI0014305BE9|nr:GDSL-type esterase/lipase family protein [Paenibacillus athensensis]MCD1257523.1 GDSL family lipase [Paenibacillus athensensis]
MEKTIHYVAWGDSLTVGYGAPPGGGFVPLFRKQAEQALKTPVQLVNAGRTGATTGQQLATLENDPKLQEQIKEASLITVTAGGNDLIQAAIPYFYSNNTDHLKHALHTYAVNYAKLLARIESLRNSPAQPRLIVLIGLYDPLPQVADAAYWVGRFNLFLRKLRKPHVRVVQIKRAFEGRTGDYLSEDYIHPNQLGYAAIADRLAQALPDELLRRLLGRL